MSEREQNRPSILLVRHGHSVGNAGHRTSGFAEIHLTDTGQEQAKRRAHQIIEHFGARTISQVIVTPYARTRETAAPLVARTGIRPLVWPDLREITYLQSSRADGTTHDERAAMRAEFWAATRENPGYTDKGEQLVDSAHSFLARVHNAMGNLAVLSTQNRGIIVAYSHEFPISAAINIASGKSDEEMIADMAEHQRLTPSIRNTQAVGLTLSNNRLIIAESSDTDLFPEAS